MNVIEFGMIVPSIRTAVLDLMTTAGEDRLGAEPRLWTYDQIPAQPEEPYGCLRWGTATSGWDRGLEVAGRGGWGAVDVIGVGRLEQSAAWVLDVLRSYLVALTPGSVAVTGDTHIKTLTSAAPPTGPIEAGTLLNMVETYDVYLEAS